MIPLPGPDAPVWSDDEPLECVAVLPEAPAVKTFAFRPPSGARIAFRAGQFVTLDLPLPGGPVQRTFTISSSPLTQAYLSVTVKVQANSLGGRWMHDHLAPGMRLRAFGPAGQFHLPDQPDGRYLFVSAGSGVTPMMSMATTLYERGEDPDICFIQCARRPSDLIFRRRLELMSTRATGIGLHFVVGAPEPYEVWTGYRGRFNRLMLGLMCNDYLDREVYCCGPAGFMDGVREILISLGYDMGRYRQESFAAPAAAPAIGDAFDDPQPDAEGAAEVVFARSGKAIACRESDTILALARGNGVPVISGCTFGLCGTCRVRKRSGEVHMVHNGGITDEDIAAGYILMCCAHPRGRVEVEA
jgi:ferredoxin-NADP reductase